MPNIQVFWATIYCNIFFLALSPARFLGSPLVLSLSRVRTAAGLLFLLLGVVGVVEEARNPRLECGPLRVSFLSGSLSHCGTYSDRGNRFFLPFLFLVIAARGTEVRRIIVALFRSALSERAFLARKRWRTPFLARNALSEERSLKEQQLFFSPPSTRRR